MFFMNSAGYMVREDEGSKISRSHGSGDWLFLYFPVPMKFICEDGSEIVSRKDACVLYAPDTYHVFCGYPDFQNSYVHFRCDEEDIKRFSFETGKIFYTPNAGKINSMIKKIVEESLTKDLMSEEMAGSYIFQLLVNAHRGINSDDDEMKKAFVKLRFEMLLNYEKNYSAEELAKRVCMSKSRFYDYYKMYFNASPKQELLKMRMENARVLLTNENITVSEVSKRVGFENQEHFTRYFKKYFREPPRRIFKSDKTSN